MAQLKEFHEARALRHATVSSTTTEQSLATLISRNPIQIPFPDWTIKSDDGAVLLFLDHIVVTYFNVEGSHPAANVSITYNSTAYGYFIQTGGHLHVQSLNSQKQRIDDFDAGPPITDCTGASRANADNKAIPPSVFNALAYVDLSFDASTWASCQGRHEKDPKITKGAGNWAVASFQGTLYQTQTQIMDFLASGTVKDAASAKIATDTDSSGVARTYVVFEA
jgi:hypothetical protein